MFFRFCAVVLFLALTSAACAGASTGDDVVAPDRPSTSGTAARVSSPGQSHDSLAPTKAADCIDASSIREMRAEYAANRLRTEKTYMGQLVCVEGKISKFRKGRISDFVEATVGEASYVIRFYDQDQRLRDKIAAGGMAGAGRSWQEWVLASNVGDTVEAECRIGGFTNANGPVVPLFESCLLMVAGAVWAGPTLTPSPTPTPVPCTATGLNDPNHGRWLNIDCPSGKVTIGIVDHQDDSDEFQSLSRGDSAMVSFYFRAPDESQGEFSKERGWKQWLEEPQGVEGVTLVWEAPPDVAATIIAGWRRGTAEELVILVGGPCCNLDLFIDLRQPPAPVRQWQPAAATAVPSPTPASTPIPTSTPTPTLRPTYTPTPTPTLASTPRPTPLSDQSPLTAEFRDVPASHNGRDAIQLQLQFTEPVSTSYKTLRDVAIQVENGTVLESKRVDKRSDLWMITIEPEGNGDIVVGLVAPAGCDDAASVCTEGGKVLANSPTALVRYQE